jgi:hypothetical protein
MSTCFGVWRAQCGAGWGPRKDFAFKVVVGVVDDAYAEIGSKSWAPERCACSATAIPLVESPSCPH